MKQVAFLMSLTLIGTLSCNRSPLPGTTHQFTQTRQNSRVQTQFFGWGKAKKLDIRLFRSYGHEQMVKIRARVIKYENKSPSENDSGWTNFIRNITGLSVAEQKDVKVRFTLNGRSIQGISDDEGMIMIDTAKFAPIQPGRYKLKAELVPGQKRKGAPSVMPIVIHPQAERSLGIISDIDDTVKYSNVANKWEAAKKLFFGSPFKAKPIAGTPTLYRILEQRIDSKNDGDIFYVSGSPINFSRQIYAFLDHQRFPQGPVELKKWGFQKGDDNPLKQSGYKLRKINEMFKNYPNRDFLLFGDSTEEDAAIYKKISSQYPGRVKGIFINNITKADPNDPHFEGVHLTNSTIETAQILQLKGILTPQDVDKVRQAL